MVVLDSCTCPRTYFMSRSISILKQHFPQIKALVTYADQTEGHKGVVYQANSWVKAGQTAPKYHYMSAFGKRINKRIPWDFAKKNGISEKEAVEVMTLTKIPELPKIKYVKALRKVKLKII